MLKIKKNEKGFTLIELMIVIAIIGILAAIAIPNFISYRDKAYCSYSETDAQSVLAAMSSYFAEPDHTTMPTVANLVAAENLTFSGSNTGTLSDQGGGVYMVTITDGSGRCPRNAVYTAYMGKAGAAGVWQ